MPHEEVQELIERLQEWGASELITSFLAIGEMVAVRQPDTLRNILTAMMVKLATEDDETDIPVQLITAWNKSFEAARKQLTLDRLESEAIKQEHDLEFQDPSKGIWRKQSGEA